MTSRRTVLALGLVLAMGACRRGDAGQARAAAPVDSARPAVQALAAFRAGIPETRELGGAWAGDRDTLVARFARALERADTAAFMPMMMNRAEFAWLYYEHDRQARPPYQLPPELMWSQVMAQGEQGITRALSRFGGRPLEYRGYACQAEERRGPNRVWTGCRLSVLDAAGRRVEARLFGGILERGGRYKIFSYANDL